MAKIGEITYKDAKNIGTKFLNPDRLEAFIGGFDKGGLNSIEADLSNGIKKEMKAGLSLESLNIEGRAPLNEIAQETLARVKVTIQDVEDIKRIARAEGNKHIKEEAQTLVEKCEEEYKKRQEAFKSGALAAYNDSDNRKHKVGEDSDGNPKYDYYSKASFETNLTGHITLSGFNSSTDASAKVENELIALNEFYDEYVKPAQDYNKKHSGLSTSTGGISKIGPKDKFNRPRGVQEGARVQYQGSSQGGKTIYTNPDGSTVEISEDANGKRHVIKNRYNYVTEEIEYGKDGKEVKRTEYSWKQSGIAGVYVAGVTEYAYKDGKEQKGNKRMTSKYAYPTKNGGVKIVDDTQKIDMNDININDAKKKAWESSYDAKMRETNSSTTDTSGFVTVTSFEDAKKVMSSDEKKPFKIEQGTAIYEDKDGIVTNSSFEAKNGPKYFTYDEKTGKYYAADKNGKIIDKQYKTSTIDPDNFVKGTNSLDNISKNNSRVTKIATSEQEAELKQNINNTKKFKETDGLDQYLQDQKTNGLTLN